MKKMLINVMAIAGFIGLMGVAGSADLADSTYACESYSLTTMALHAFISALLLAPKLLESEEH